MAGPMVRMFLVRVLRPVARLLLHTPLAMSPWERHATFVPLHVYGMGLQCGFDHYFEGKSTINVASLDDIVDWLLGCTYTSDQDLFDTPDYWQHPCVFEKRRQGDCEDFSLWAWRKMVRLGYDAEFMVGYATHPAEEYRAHAWIVYRQGDCLYLFDPIVRGRSQMIVPLDNVADAYLPEVSVDGDLVRYAYGGYYLRHRRPGTVHKR